MKQMSINELMDEIESLPEDDVLKLLTEVNNRKNKNEKERIRNVVESHKSYVGKCYYRIGKYSEMFPEMKKYYKIISERGSNELHLSALTFFEHPMYWFEYQMSLQNRPGNFYFGYYDFKGIEVDDFGAFCRGNNGDVINDFVEISLERYNEAMNKYIKELQEMKWPADHYNLGGKLPSDPDWKRRK